MQIIEKQELIDLIRESKQIFNNEVSEIESKLTLIQDYFNELKKLITFLDHEDFQKQFQCINDNSQVKGIIGLRSLKKESQLNILLPLLAFMGKISSNKNDVYQLLRRLRKNYFDNKWPERKSNYVDWRYVLQIIEKSKLLEECLKFEADFEQIGNLVIPIGVWYNQEENLKDELKDEYKDKIEYWEDHQDFMGDLSFLFSTNESFDSEDNQLSNSDLINRLDQYYKNYCETIDLIRSEEHAETNILLTNYFRLFRLFIECNKVGHIYCTSWDFEGVLFSTLNRVHLEKEEFKQLCRCETAYLQEFCISYIKKQIDELELFNLSGDNFDVDKFIKYWLTLKVFYADMKKTLISRYDGNETGVAAYIEKDKNKLIENLPFSIENSICGFGVKKGFGAGNYVRTNIDQGSNPNVINAPFAKIKDETKKSGNIDLEQNKKVIDSIIEFIKTGNYGISLSTFNGLESEEK